MSAAPPPIDERRWIVVLLVAALVVRATWLLELAGLPWAEDLPTDSFFYDQAARRIARGDWLLDAHPLRMSPAYFYVLGAVHTLFGSGVWAIRLLQMLAGALTVLGTWRVARRIVSAELALVAAGLVSFSGPLIFFDAAILPESLATLGVVCVAWTVARAVGVRQARGQELGVWALSGLSIGVLATLRPNAILLVPIVSWLAIHRAPSRRTGLGCALAVGLAAALAIAPITARNALASGRFVPLTAHGGVNLYVGNGPGATGTFRVPEDIPDGGSPATQFEAFREAASREVGRELDEAEADRHWQSRTLAHVATHPLDAVVLFARKVHLLFNARELGLVLPYAFSRESTSTMGAPLVQTGWIAPLALVGLGLGLFRRAPRSDEERPELVRVERERVEVERALCAVTLGLVVSVALVFVTDRYRAPLVPLFAVHAVACIGALRELVRARARRHLALLAVSLVLAALLAWPVRANQHFEREWIALGDGFFVEDQAERALDAYEHGLALAPGHPLATAGIARSLTALGDVARARSMWTALRDDAAAPEALRREAARALETLAGR